MVEPKALRLKRPPEAAQECATGKVVNAQCDSMGVIGVSARKLLRGYFCIHVGYPGA